MTQTFLQPTVLDACFQARIRENFAQAIDSLEQVVKNLNFYLNGKRAAFPRFYFLSNDELL
jgi:dynein heavy chain